MFNYCQAYDKLEILGLIETKRSLLFVGNQTITIIIISIDIY